MLVAFATSEAESVRSVCGTARRYGAVPLATIRAAFVALVGPITTREGLANNLAFLQIDLTDPELRDDAIAQSRSIRSEVAALLDQGRANGEIECEPNELADTAYTAYAVYCGALVTWAIDGSPTLASWLVERRDRALTTYRRTTLVKATEDAT